MVIPQSDYRAWDGVEMARLVQEGQVSAEDLAETALARIDRLGALNAVASLAATAGGDGDAGGDSDSGAGRQDRNFGEGALAGVPFAVKELLAWPGLPWTMGSRLMAANQAPGLLPYAARIKDCGLNVICSAASSEFGMLGSTETALHGTTLNPWGAGLSAGGSSGGSAALVAAGIVPMAHGDDAGGSLRVPAALCGVFGFKPSNRRCAPAWPDASGFAALVAEHCISRSVRDSAAFLAATERTGPDAVYPPTGMIAGPDPARLRIALLTPTLLGRQPDDAVARELDRAAKLCESLGHHVETADPLGVDGQALSDGYFTAAGLAMAQMAKLAAQTLGRPPGPSELEPFTLELIDWAASLGPGAPADCERALADGGRAYRRLFERCDVVLSPTLARVSWPIGHLSPAAGRETVIRRTEEAVGYTPIHNAAGSPAMTVPLGRHDGLPVGIHFAAAPGADRLLLALAYELEAAAPWADTMPDTSWLAGRT